MTIQVGNTSGQPNDYQVDTGAGAVGAGTQRVTLANDLTALGATTVANARHIFKDGFADPTVAQPDATAWDLVTDDAGHLVTQGGNSSGASYLRISLSPFVDGSQIALTSKAAYTIPMRVGYGLSMSQRIVGQEVFVGLVGVDANNAVETITATNDQAIVGATASITTNVATFTVTAHGFKGGDRVDIFGCIEPRLNVGPVIVTPLTADTFTVPCTLANGTYSTTGGYVRVADPVRWAKNAGGILFENATVTNGSFVARRNGAKFRSTNSTTATTTATQTNVAPYTDAFNSAGVHEIGLTLDEISYRSWTPDGVATMSGIGKYNNGVPEESKSYKIQVRSRNLTGMTMPVGRITGIAKTGTTTATVTTDVAHGLTTSDWVQVYGVRDQSNFPNLTAQTVVSSVIDANNFTVIIGSATTTSSLDGTVYKCIGSMLAPGIQTGAVISVTRTSNVLTVIGTAAFTMLPGEYVHLYGLTAAAAGYEGAYKVLRVNTTTMELESVGVDFATITTGGAVIKRTDVRVHFVRMLDYTRILAEIVGGRGNTSDINNAVPVSIAGSATLSVSAAQSTGSATAQWNASGLAGLLVNDVVSAAITVSTTSATITPGQLANVGAMSHTFTVGVTAVSGTTPTMDVGVDESMDNGTTWSRIYDFERITATGVYTSPQIRAQYGTRYRYVRTVGGTTPSFTHAVNRTMFGHQGQLFNRYIDRTIVLTTLNSTTPTYLAEGCDMFQLIVKVGAITTTAPQLVLEGSETGISTDWYTILGPVTAVASSAVQVSATGIIPKFVRGRVSTAGVGVTADHIAIKALGR